MSHDLLQLSPILLVLLTGLAVLTMDLVRHTPDGGSRHLAYLSAMGLALAIGAVTMLWPGSDSLQTMAMASMVVVDGYTLFAWALLAGLTVAAVLLSVRFDEDNNLDHGEYYGLLLMAVVGLMAMVASRHLVLLLVSLETLSLALYALVAMKRVSGRGLEAALKYFLNGGMASALMLYGMALLWGETGTLTLADLGTAIVAGGDNPLLYVGGGLLLVGFGVKVALVPFHMWTPDAYQGAPTPVAGFMASVVKAGVVLTLFRVIYSAMVPQLFGGLPFSYVDAIIAVAVLTMVVGNLLALHQTDVKRMLAYSSIAHAGFVALGLLFVPTLGSGHPELRFINPSVLYYLVAYGGATLLAFGVLTQLGAEGNEDASLGRLSGLGRRRPGLALLLTLALLSLAGFPPTAGFMAKFGLFRELMVIGRGKLTILLVIAVVNALLSVAYYLRPIVHMYMVPAKGDERELRNGPATVALLILAAAILALGMWPGKVDAPARTAAHSVTYDHAPNLFGKGPAKLAPFAKRPASE